MMTRTTRRGARAVLALLVLIFAVVTAATAFAVDVTGRIEAPAAYGAPPPPTREPRSRDYYWEERNYFLEARPYRYSAARHLAVVIVGPGAAVADQPGFRLRNGGLWPETMVARAGEAIQIANDDPVTYELMADGLASFGAVPTPPGRARTLDAIAEPGHWPIHDRVQTHVHGHLHVVPDLIARAEIRADGSYVFHGVPAGTYTLKVFEGEREVAVRPIEVVEGHELTVDPIHMAQPTTPAPAQ